MAQAQKGPSIFKCNNAMMSKASHSIYNKIENSTIILNKQINYMIK